MAVGGQTLAPRVRRSKPQASTRRGQASSGSRFRRRGGPGNGQLLLVDGVRNTTAKRVNDELQFDPQMTVQRRAPLRRALRRSGRGRPQRQADEPRAPDDRQSGPDTINDEDGNITSDVRHMAWKQTYDTDVEVTLAADEAPAGPVHVASRRRAAASHSIPWRSDAANGK